jgi:NodT family efflux transporter outer membrane factor (OMF) lipoprotein
MTLRRTMIGILAPPLLLAACSFAPDYERPVTATIPADFKEAPGWKVAAPSDAVARGEWWTLFGDPVLDSLQRKVLVSNQNLASAKAAYDLARAVVREQRAAFFPIVDLSGSATRGGTFGSSRSGSGGSGGSTSSDRYALSVGATWEPDLWGRIGNTVTQAGAEAEASRADLVNATLSAQGELALNYVQIRGIEAQKAILEATIEAYYRALAITRNRYESGVVQRSDVLQAETALRNARADAADLDRQHAAFEHAIAVLVGENPSTFALPPAPRSQLVPDAPSILPSTLLERRPDIAAAERRVAAANANIGIQRAAYFPAILLSGDVGYNAQRLGALFDSASSVWSLGLSGVLTLLDFGARSARVDEARAAYEQTVADYRQTMLTAFQQTEDQLAAARILETVAAERAGAASAATEAEEIARNQYLVGQISYADLIVAQTTALAARRAEAQALVDRRVAVISLIQAIGGDWSDATPLTRPLPPS